MSSGTLAQREKDEWNSLHHFPTKIGCRDPSSVLSFIRFTEKLLVKFIFHVRDKKAVQIPLIFSSAPPELDIERPSDDTVTKLSAFVAKRNWVELFPSFQFLTSSVLPELIHLAYSLAKNGNSHSQLPMGFPMQGPDPYEYLQNVLLGLMVADCFHDNFKTDTPTLVTWENFSRAAIFGFNPTPNELAVIPASTFIPFLFINSNAQVVFHAQWRLISNIAHMYQGFAPRDKPPVVNATSSAQKSSSSVNALARNNDLANSDDDNDINNNSTSSGSNNIGLDPELLFQMSIHGSICFNCKKPGHHAKDCPSTRQCSICQRKGHVASQCYSRKNGKSPSHQVNCLDHLLLNASRKTGDTANANAPSVWMTECTVGNVSRKALADTGSSANLILRSALPLGAQLMPEESYLSALSGPVRASSKVLLDLFVNKRTIRAEFIVVDSLNSFDLIIGNGLLLDLFPEFARISSQISPITVSLSSSAVSDIKRRNVLEDKTEPIAFTLTWKKSFQEDDDEALDKKENGDLVISVPSAWELKFKVLSDKFRKEMETFGNAPCSVLTHSIPTTGTITEARPVREYSAAELSDLREFVAKSLENGVIEGPLDYTPVWNGRIHSIRVPGKATRFVYDNQQLNELVDKSSIQYPYTTLAHARTILKNAKYFVKLDFSKAYHQILIAVEDRDKTAFRIPGLGVFRFARVPFGIPNASASMQRIVDKLFGKYLDVGVVSYQDDIVFGSSDLQGLFTLTEKILSVISKHFLKLNFDKCRFALVEIEYLSFDVSFKGWAPSKKSIASIFSISRPNT